MSNRPDPIPRRRALRCLTPALAVAATVTWMVLAPCALAAAPPQATALAAGSPQAGQSAAVVKPQVSATLDQCVTSINQNERAATFAGEMATIPGAVKLEMRIDVLVRLPRELAFHAVAAPALDVWRIAAPGVKNYRYLKEVTNLSAPAAYRAAVHFRWLNAKGRLIRAAELRTPRCLEPATPGAGHKLDEESVPVA